jgi:deoxyxylulose-5-phosphate synthase
MTGASSPPGARRGCPRERLARHHEVLITVEEGSIGGFGSAVLPDWFIGGQAITVR